MISEEDPSVALDAAMILRRSEGGALRNCRDGSLATYAKLLEMDEAAELLETTLAEEKEADEKLTSIASELNLLAEEAATE